MDIKINILKKIAGIDEDIKYIISHHILTYFWLMIMSFIGIIILFFLYKLIAVFDELLARNIIWILGLGLYIYFVLNFLDIYLDAVMITDRSIVIYKWYWLFKTTADVISLHAIESVYANQNWLIDTLFNKWDIIFRRAWHENLFDNVYNPQDAANKINYMLSTIEEKEVEKEEEEWDFQMFVEAMAEVIKEYKSKNNNSKL